MSSTAVRGRARTFQILFIRSEDGTPTSVINPTIEIFHYNDLDGSTGSTRVEDVTETMIPDPITGQYHFVWHVPSDSPIGQVRYARYSGIDPINSKELHCEESFVIVSANLQPPGSSNYMTASFVKF